MKNYTLKFRSGEPDEVISADTVEEVTKNGVDWLVFRAYGDVVAKVAEDSLKSWKVAE